MFPMPLLQHANGQATGLSQVIDELTANHRALAAYLHRAQEAVAALPGNIATRYAAAHTIGQLTTRLTGHLDKEEQQLAPTLDAVSRIVPEHEIPPPPPRAPTRAILLARMRRLFLLSTTVLARLPDG